MRTMPRTLTIAEAILPGHGILREALVILSLSWLIALSARIAFFVPGVPVAVTGQTFAVLLVGALLGSRRGALAVLAYLAQGAAGLPVFTISATLGYGGGIARFLGPSAGFLVGFVFAAFVVGLLAERGWDRRPWTMALAMLAGEVVIYVFGLPWMAQFFNPAWLAPWQQSLLWLDPTGGSLVFGLYPYIPGDLLKLAVATAVLPSAWAVIHRFKS